MKILICNERFLFRFGVDRVLLLLAMRWRDVGHEIILMGNKFDSDVARSVCDRIIFIPEAPEYINSNEYAADYLATKWQDWFPENNNPDIILVGGWPFYSSFKFMSSHCKKLIYHDYGAVPLDKMSGGALVVQTKLRQLRDKNIGYCDKVIAISDFIRTTQSDYYNINTKSVTIYLGADHLVENIWKKETGEIENHRLFHELNDCSKKGVKIIFLSGRWETHNYKNSCAAFRIAELLIKDNLDFKIVILEEKEKVAPPDTLEKYFIFAAHLSDNDMQKVMEMSDCGFCTSLWEGYNLPLAEMQYMNKAMFVLNIGAHPEIIVHPWFLSDSIDEMGIKIIEFLKNGLPFSADEYQVLLHRFKERFTWDATSTAMLTEMSKKEKIILMDVTASSCDSANNGIIRVTRKLGRHLQGICSIVFVIWDGSQYVFPTLNELEILSSFGGPLSDDVKNISPSYENRKYLIRESWNISSRDYWLLLPEIHTYDNLEKIISFADAVGINTCSIFYDAIPWVKPEFCNNAVKKNHKRYMEVLAGCDLILAIAEHNKDDLLRFWNYIGIEPCLIKSVQLPGEFDKKAILNSNQSLQKPKDSFWLKIFGIDNKNNNIAVNGRDIGMHAFCMHASRRKILFVSTLEPRKNHLRFYLAVDKLLARKPELKNSLEILLVGKKYEDDDIILKATTDFCKKYAFAHYLGVVDDINLRKLYEQCDLTAYPSEIEGFGMPIMESIYFGKPCLCSNTGSIGELGREGGCCQIDVCSETKIAEALEKLITDNDYYKKLKREAENRKVKTWMVYAAEVLDSLDGAPKISTKRVPGIVKKELASWLAKFGEKQKILVCSNFYPPQFVGGAEIIAHEQAKSIARLSHCPVLVFSLDHTANIFPGSVRLEWHERIPVIRVSAPQDGDPYSNYRNALLEEIFTELCEFVRPDIAHMHNIMNMSVAMIGIARKFNAKIYVTLHDYWGFCYKNTNVDFTDAVCETNDNCEICFSRQKAAGAWPCLRINAKSMLMRQRELNKALSLSEGLISPSKYLADVYIKRGFPASKFHVLENGLDIPRFASLKKIKDTNCFRIGFCGYFGRHKGVADLIRAVCYLKRPDIDIVLAGDGEERENYKEIARSLNLKGHLIFEGKINNSDIGNYYSKLDIYCLPSVWPENQPVSITEALACGIPVIASDMGGNCELIENGKNGFLFKAGDWRELAEKIVFFINHREELEKFSRYAALSAKRFDINKQAARLMELYDIKKESEKDWNIIPWYEPRKLLSFSTPPLPEMSEFESAFICGIIKKIQPQKIVEIGVASGGTTAIILHALDMLGLKPEFYSIDKTGRYYLNPEKSTGFMAHNIKEKSDIEHRFLFDSILPKWLPGIGSGIDLAILDTMHRTPGEILDFLAILPFMSDGGIIVLHDLAANFTWGDDTTFATSLLFTAASGKKIYMRENGNLPNIGAIVVSKEETLENIFDVFHSLLLPWHHTIHNTELDQYNDWYKKFYSPQLCNLFADIIRTKNKLLI